VLGFTRYAMWGPLKRIATVPLYEVRGMPACSHHSGERQDSGVATTVRGHGIRMTVSGRHPMLHTGPGHADATKRGPG